MSQSNCQIDVNIPLLNWLHPGRIASRKIDAIRSKGLVASGPFRGLPASNAALDGNWPYLLGLYEIQLHDVIESLFKRQYPLIVDVGGGSGYYAIGTAFRQPQARVVVFESLPDNQASIENYARKSGIAEKIDLREHCHTEDLLAVVSRASQGLLLMDCEGGERELLGDAMVAPLRGWSILQEIHDWHAPGAAEEIHNRFQSSHHIKEIWSRELQATDLNFMLSWPMTHLCLPYVRRMCDENRGGPMRYFLMEPKAT